MTKIFNKISYVLLLVILFGLIAIFFIIRNILILNNNIEFEATCFSYETKKNEYIVSYYYKHNDQTFYIKEVQNEKPKLGSKINIYCSKSGANKCILDKKRYVKGLYISVLALLPSLVFIVYECVQKKYSIKNGTNKK